MMREEVSRCSLLFALSPLLLLWGLGILGTSLGTLAVTTSFLQVFPFAAPLWTGTILLILGCFILVAFRPSGLQLPASSSRAQIWFTLVISLVSGVECLLAISLSMWYREIISPALQNCFPDLTSSTPPYPEVTCECNHDFIDPPSLRITVHHFVGVSDCSSLSNSLSAFQWVLLTLYSIGVILSILVGCLTVKKLHSLGVCGKSGVYSVTPQVATPPPDSTISCQPSLTLPGNPSNHSTASTLPGFTLNRLTEGSSQGTVFGVLYNQSPTLSRSQPIRLRLVSSASSPSHTTV